MKSLPFFKGLSWLIVLNLLVKPVWIFFIDRQVQNIVGYEEYGKYFAVLNLSYVLLFLADPGLSNMLNQRIANNASVNVRQLLGIKLILLAVYFIACCFIGWLTHITQWSLLFYVVIIWALTSLFVFLRSVVTANQYFTADAWFSVIDKLLMTVVCGAIIYSSLFGTISLLLFLKIQLACTAATVAAAFFFILKKQLLPDLQKETIELIVRSVLPFAVIILLMAVHYRLDGFLLERIHYNGAYEAGVYAAAYRLLDAGNMVGYLAATFLLPFVARHQKEKKVIEDVITNTKHGLLFFCIGIVTFVIMFAPWIQQLLYHSANPYHAKVLAFCIAALPGYFLVHIYGSVLVATSRFNFFTGILIVSVIINIVLNIILIPAYGALGCCIAALFSQYFCGIAAYVVATKSLNISFDHKANLIYLFFAAMLIGFFYFSKTIINNVWAILAIAICITIFLLAILTGIFKKHFISLR